MNISPELPTKAVLFILGSVYLNQTRLINKAAFATKMIMLDEVNTNVDDTTTSASEETTEVVETTETVEETTVEIDYKKELEAAQSRIGKADHTIVEEKGKRKTAEEELVKAKENAGLDENTIRTIIREENQSFHKETRKNDVENKLRSVTRSEGEYELAMHHYQNSIVISGNDQEDIENAVFLANKKRFSSDLSESMASARSKDTVVTQPGGAGTKPKVERNDDINLSDSDKHVLKAYGITAEQNKSGYDRKAELEKMKTAATKNITG